MGNTLLLYYMFDTQDPAAHDCPGPVPDVDRFLPTLVVALGVKLIGRNPLFSGVATGTPSAPPLAVAAVPRKLATRLPKKLPIPLPIPPIVDRISASGGLVAPPPPPPATALPPVAEGVDTAGEVAGCCSFRIRSASSRSFIRAAIFVRAPSNALKRDDEPVANAEEPAAKALLRTSRVGASD